MSRTAECSDWLGITNREGLCQVPNLRQLALNRFVLAGHNDVSIILSEELDKFL